MCVCMYVHMYVYMCVEATDWCKVFSASTFYLSFWWRVTQWTWKFTHTDRLASDWAPVSTGSVMIDMNTTSSLLWKKKRSYCNKHFADWVISTAPKASFASLDIATGLAPLDLNQAAQFFSQSHLLFEISTSSQTPVSHPENSCWVWSLWVQHVLCCMFSNSAPWVICSHLAFSSVGAHRHLCSPEKELKNKLREKI